MSINDLDTKVTTLRELQAEIERLTAEAEAVKDELKAEMIERGSDVLGLRGIPIRSPSL